MKRHERGSSIAEVLTVTVIIAMLLSAMVVVAPVVGKASAQMQSQVDEVDTAAIALYKIRRDFSEADTTGVMGCSTSPGVSCSSPGAAQASVQALVVPTAEDASGAFQIDKAGDPWWQGFYVYWLAPNAAATSYDLMRAYVHDASIYKPGIGRPSGVTAAIVNADVTAAMAITPAPVLVNNIAQMKLGDSGASSTINFELIAGTTAGADQAQTRFQSNTYARN